MAELIFACGEVEEERPETQILYNHMKINNQPAPMDQQQISGRRNAIQAEHSKSGGIQDAQVNRNEETVSADQTSKYLKVLSQLENLLAVDALPEAALEGFVGAVKKKIDQLSDAEKQRILKLPEAKALELKDLQELPGKIQESMVGLSQAKGMLKLLKTPQFAKFMQGDRDGVSPGTYGRNGVIKTAGNPSAAIGALENTLPVTTISTTATPNHAVAG